MLNDPQQRQHYDYQIKKARAKRTPRSFGPEPLIPNRRKTVESLIQEDLDEISMTRSYKTYHPSFDEIFDRLWSNFGNLSHPKSETTRNLTVEVPVWPDQARHGGNVRILIPALVACPTCRGNGVVGPYECWRCTGEGSISEEYPLSIAIPADIEDGYVIEIPLSRFGIHNFYLQVSFRIAGSNW